jgi:DNA repair exonuclease SbcCD nuclease subunit
MSLRLLLVGDMHLGKQPRLSSTLQTLGIEGADIAPSAAWRRAAELAIEHEVHAVLCAGDLVNQKENCFEALAELLGPLKLLQKAGIPVYAVAGNHDVEALPMIAQWVEATGFHLLGAKGVWESVELVGDDDSRVEIVGWSFPSQVYLESPLAGLPPRQNTKIPRVGLLHCDRDGHSSYAPVSSAELVAAPVDAWFLGHIHIPDLRGLQQSRPMGYLGCLSPIRRKEVGWHGPWLATLNEAAQFALEPLPGSPLRLESIDCDLHGFDGSLEALESYFQDRVRKTLEAADEAMELKDDLRVVRVRLRLLGAVADPLLVDQVIAAADYDKLSVPIHGRNWVVDWLRNDCTRQVDLQGLSRGHDPPAHLAKQQLQLLEGQGDDLIEAFRESLRQSALGSGRWSRWPEPDEQELRHLLLRRGARQLAQLLAQKTEVSGET